MKRISLLAVLALALAGTATQADAAEIFAGVLNDGDITLAEHLYNSDGTLDQDNVADVGDLLVGVFSINKIQSGAGTWFASATDQLTGVFVQQVAAVDVIDANTSRLTLSNPGALPLFTNVGGAGTYSIALPGGSMFAVYEDLGATVLNPLANTDTATQVATATDGSLFMALGLNGGTDTTFGIVNYFGGGPFIVDGGAYGALSVVVNNTGYDFADVTEFTDQGPLTGQVVFTADFDTNTFGGPWSIYGNDPTRFLPRESVIPEPASMLMLGMGMGGIGLVNRRRKIKA